MPFPSTGFQEIVASSVGQPVTKTLQPLVYPPNRDIRAIVMMTELVNNTRDPQWAAGVYISQYVQGGVKHPLPDEEPKQYRQLFGHDITEIVLSATAYNCDVIGNLMVEML